MESTLTAPSDLRLHVHQEIEIHAPAAIVFESILDQAGPGMTDMQGKSLNLRIEPFPGGRWFRDLGNNTGHFWGHVQVIKPPTLLEFVGPMMMSYPVSSHVQYKLTEKSGVTTLSLTHRAFGEILKDHREGVKHGWNLQLQNIKKHSEK